MGNNLGGPDAQKLRGRAVLTLRNPLIESALAAANFDQNDIQQAAVWGNALLRARDDWARQYRGGKRYSDETAERERNTLGGWQKGGRK